MPNPKFKCGYCLDAKVVGLTGERNEFSPILSALPSGGILTQGEGQRACPYCTLPTEGNQDLGRGMSSGLSTDLKPRL